MPRKFAYCRVSHRNSAESGLSVKAQVSEILENSWHEGEWFDGSHGKNALPGFAIDNAVSAWKVPFASRPAGKWICENIQPGDHIYFYSIDRGFRSLLDFCKLVPHWVEQGINVHVIAEDISMDSANGRLLANVLAAFAEWKSDMQSERAKEVAYMRKIGIAGRKSVRFQWEPGAKIYDDVEPAQAEKHGKIYSYIRVSHVYSAKSGLSVEVQRKSTSVAKKRLSKRHPGLIVAGEFVEEAVSAYRRDLRGRPVGKALDQVLTEGDVVVFHKPDRAFRSMKDMVLTVSDWMNRGITLYFADSGIDSSTPNGRMFLKMLCMLAEWESDIISQRTKAALKIARKEGRKMGGTVPNACVVSKYAGKKRLKISRELVKWMRYIVFLRNIYGLSWEKISDRIEARMAKDEGREEIPACGTWKKINPKHRHRRGLHDKSVVNRPYSTRRCRREYDAWPRIRRALAQGEKLGPK